MSVKVGSSEHMTTRQVLALHAIHERYGAKEWNARDFWHTFDLPEGYVAGWVLDRNGERAIYVGVSADGEISS